MISMIPHPKISLDDIGDALRGPNIRGVCTPSTPCCRKRRKLEEFSIVFDSSTAAGFLIEGWSMPWQASEHPRKPH